jgi:hypothetical protein
MSINGTGCSVFDMLVDGVKPSRRVDVSDRPRECSLAHSTPCHISSGTDRRLKFGVIKKRRLKQCVPAIAGRANDIGERAEKRSLLRKFSNLL